MRALKISHIRQKSIANWSALLTYCRGRKYSNGNDVSSAQEIATRALQKNRARRRYGATASRLGHDVAQSAWSRRHMATALFWTEVRSRSSGGPSMLRTSASSLRLTLPNSGSPSPNLRRQNFLDDPPKTCQSVSHPSLTYSLVGGCYITPDLGGRPTSPNDRLHVRFRCAPRGATRPRRRRRGT